MADKVPVKATFDSAGDADGLSEFVSGDTVAIAHGGTGLAAVGSAGQILRTNSAANAIEWGAAEVLNIDGMTDGTSVTLADTDKLAISDSKLSLDIAVPFQTPVVIVPNVVTFEDP